MRTPAFAALLAMAFGLFGPPVSAEDTPRDTIGWGRLFNNDYLGDGQDRWRTGGYAVSRLTGTPWDGQRAAGFGDTVELRFRSEILAPDDLVTPDPGDRPYAGSLSVGLHTHWRRRGTEFSFGGDLVFTGPQTGLGDFQRDVHDWVDAPIPQVLDDQIDDGIYPTLLGEVAQPYRLGERVTLRPFVEAQAGIETLVRLGGDMIFGGVGHDDLLIRDVTTGHLMRTARTEATGLSFVLGGDIASVADSAFLPEEDGFELTDSRNRLRAGVHWQGPRAGVFYGLTWLGEEFEAQPEEQVTGSLRVDFNF